MSASLAAALGDKGAPASACSGSSSGSCTLSLVIRRLTEVLIGDDWECGHGSHAAAIAAIAAIAANHPNISRPLSSFATCQVIDPLHIPR